MMYLMIALGGALGALARFLVSGWFVFPLGTLAVNLVGSFVMGLAFVFLSSRGLDRVMFFAMTGFLGAFTTFSAFSLDVFKLIETERMADAMGYVAVSVIGAIVALFIGVFLAKGVCHERRSTHHDFCRGRGSTFGSLVKAIVSTPKPNSH